MALFRTLNALRRDTVGLALQTLGLQSPKVPAHKAGPTLYRTFDAAAMRRTATPAPPPPVPSFAHTPTVLQVRELLRETADAVSIVLARVDGGPIDFQAGMFFTVIVVIDGQEYRRAYSASSAAQANTTLTLTVKRVAHGTVSNWLNDALTVGSTLRVLGPSGSFVVAPPTTPVRKLLLVAGGSGITPLMSIARTVLAQEPATHIDLLYGNRGKKDTIFYATLNAMQKQYPKRLSVQHVFERAPAAWKGETGRLDRATFARMLDRVLAGSALGDLQVYTCGPEPVMAAVAAEVLARGLPALQLHQEKFAPAAALPDMARFVPQTLAVQAGGSSWAGTVQAGQTLLDAGLACGAPMLFSCTLGGCGRCRVKVLQGVVDMPEPNALTPEEKAQGYALACIARPCSTVRIAMDTPPAH